MSQIRKIRRNISEAATGQRCNRYGDERRKPSFKSYRKQIVTHLDNLFSLTQRMPIGLPIMSRLYTQQRRPNETTSALRKGCR